MGLVTLTGTASGYTAIQTQHIDNTQHDGFITPAGIGIDSHLLHILDPSMDVRGFLIFLDIHIDSWEYLDNATLRLTSASTLPFDADSSITVYGMAGYDLQTLSGLAIYSPGTILSWAPTSAHVNVNTSQFYGGVVMDIDVKNIVQEIYGNPHWDGDLLGGVGTGDAMGFLILGAQDEVRYFYDYLGSPGRSADLIIGYNNNPQPPPGGGDFNESYRGLNIFEIDLIGENRTGQGMDVNWNLLDMTELIEIDSGVSINVVNATLTELTAFQDQAVNALYNDTGSLNVDSYFVRFAVNITGVHNGQVFNDRNALMAGIGTATPVGSAGMIYGNSGDHVGLTMTVDQDDERFLFRLYERSGVDRRFSSTSGWLDEDDGVIWYFEFVATSTWELISMYSDPEFTNEYWTSTRVYEVASGPFRYPSIIASAGAPASGGIFINTAEYHTYLTMPVENATSWTVTYENGTVIVEGLDDYEDAIIYIDTVIIGDPDPVEANPPGLGYPTEGPFTRFRMRGYVFMMGFFCVFGPIWFFAWKRPSAYYLFVGALIIITGVGLMMSVAII